MEDTSTKQGALAELARLKSLEAAVGDMVKALSDTDGALGNLTCAEFGTVLDVAVIAGFSELAVDLVIGHARGDDDADDEHHMVYLAIEGDDEDSAERLARRFL